MTDLSSPGDAVTALEVMLVSDCACRGTWEAVAWRLNRRLQNPNLTATVLAEILDELGSNNVHVPKRQHFFTALYRRWRDREIRRIAAKTPLSEIAELYGMSKGRASQIITSGEQP